MDRKKLYTVGNYWIGLRQGSPKYYICYLSGGRVVRVSTKTTILSEAAQKLREFAQERSPIRRKASFSEDWYDVAGRLWHAKNTAAKSMKMEFDITVEDIYLDMEAHGFRCAVSGIRYCFDKPGNVGRNPWAPSIDRIDCSDGYVKGNIRIVCLAANLAMNEWGYDMLLRLSNGVVSNSFAYVPSDNTVQEGALGCIESDEKARGSVGFTPETRQ